MASEIECIIFVLDVGKNSGQLTQKSIEFTTEIVKDKICVGKKSYISFVLFGTERTQNCANENIDSERYMNIIQYPHIISASWELLIEFFLLTIEPKTSQAEWLDAISVAIEMLKTASEKQKFARCKIVLFHDFNSTNPHYDSFDAITKDIKELDIELIVISTNIVYIDDDDGLPQILFRDWPEKSAQQRENEEYALRLPQECNAILRSFYDSLHAVSRTFTRRPWTWNCALKIGSKITINLSGVIPIKDEVLINFKRRIAGNGESVQMVKKYFCGALEIFPNDDDLIDGYMLGATAVPYDSSLGQKSVPTEKGLKFVGFVKRHLVPEEYFVDGSLYWLVHRKNMAASARMMDALVKAMLDAEVTILAWKVYNNGNTPKIVILLPNEIDDKNYPNRPPSLTMAEMAYQSQLCYWDFPKLRTRKTEPTSAQIESIDKLIDAMNLTMDKCKTRETLSKDLLPFKFLPDIFQQHLLNTVEKHVYENCCEENVASICSQMSKAVNFWKVPSPIEQQSIEAAKMVKEHFTLEETAKASKPKTGAHFGQTLMQQADHCDAEIEKQQTELIKIDRVGTVTPAEDFETLMQGVVLKIESVTFRNAKFQEIAYNMRSVIWDLLFKSLTDQRDKVAAAMKIFREYATKFNPDDYNDWIAEVRQKILNRQMYDFWENVIVKEQLGLCFGEYIREDKEAEENFYKIDKNANHLQNIAGDDGAGDDVDDLLANM